MKSKYEKRAVCRILALMECHCFNTEYFGMITDLSEKGMLIRSQKMRLPFDLNFTLSIYINDRILNINARIVRIVKTSGSYSGLGVELIAPPEAYLKYVATLRTLADKADLKQACC